MDGVLTLLLVGGFGATAMMASLGGALVKRIGTASPAFRGPPEKAGEGPSPGDATRPNNM